MNDNLHGHAAEQLPAPLSGGREVTPVLLAWIAENVTDVGIRDALLFGIAERDTFGRQKYGQPLLTGDGRRTAVEVWQELLDALQYTTKAEMEGERVDSTLMCTTLLLLCRKVLRSDDAGELDTAARRAYDAYNEAGPAEKRWLTWDGRPVPRWPDLPETIREKWRAAVLAGAGDRR